VSGWDAVQIADVTTKVGSGATPKGGEAAYKASGTPLIRSMNVHFDGFREDGLAFIDDEQAAALKNVEVRAGDVLLNITGASIGRVTVAPSHMDGARVNQHVCIIRPDKRLDPSFLRWFLASPHQQKLINSVESGATRQALTKEKILGFEVPLPVLDAQRGIVAEIEKQFSRLDEAVANLQRVKANLKRYKTAVLKAAVEGRLVETEAELARRERRSYETGEQLLQRILTAKRNEWAGKGKYKEPTPASTAVLPALPEGWTWATMPQLGELNRGKSKHRPRDDAALYGGPYPFIQTGDVRRSDGSITEYTQTYSEFGLKQSRLWPAGTLCITIAANIAETGILKLEACFPDSVVGFVSHQGSPTTEYVEYFVRTAREGLDRFASATAQKNINLEVLEAVAVPTPPLAEQRRITDEVERRLSIVREVEGEVDANLQRAQALRHAVLSKSFAT
jgi:type I restriction enzyme S subunit